MMTAMMAQADAQTRSTTGNTVAMAPAVKITRADISLDGAERAIDASMAEAARNGWTISVAVVDVAGELVAFRKAGGAIGISPGVAMGKARTAALLQAPSKEFEEFINNGRPSFLSTPGVTALEGGVPSSSTAR